jgi:hypothetical protein
MDAGMFDDVSRSLSVSPTRRGIARILAGITLAAPLGALLDPEEVVAKKRKKKCKKKCDACSRCKKGKCRSRCTAAETCLANGSCGTTCDNDGQCAMGTCSCEAEDGGDPVCRIPASNCTAQPPCESTSDCAPGNVCSFLCNPGRCFPLC